MSLADLLKRSSKPDQQKKMINRLTAQVEVNQALANSGDLDELMKQASEARKLVDAERMILYTIEGASLVSRVSGDGKKKASRKVHIPLVNGNIPTHVANTGETVNIPDITDPFELKRLGQGVTYDARLFAPLHGRKRAKAILAGPVIYHGRTVGVLEAVNKASGESFISLIAALQASIVLGIAIAIGVTFHNYLMIAPIMGIVILFSLGFSGISVTVAATAKSQETFWGIINFLGMPLFMLSPALFPLELMPTWLATLASLNPATYAILMIREMMSGVTQDISLIMGLGILLVFAGVMVAIASYVFRKEVNKPF